MDGILEKIIKEMTAQGKKQYELTDFLGLNHNTFGNWKSGLNQSYLKYLHAIADFLGVSVEYLKGETDIKEKPLSENEERLKELYNLTADLTDSDIDVLKAFVAGLKANRNKD
jgi:transcriptional regulator with XRE-family HTH domain